MNSSEEGSLYVLHTPPGRSLLRLLAKRFTMFQSPSLILHHHLWKIFREKGEHEEEDKEEGDEGNIEEKGGV